MKITKAKEFSSIILLVTVFVSLFFLSKNEVHALRCASPQNIFVAAYEQGNFLDGFTIKHRHTGNICDTRPVVSERTDNLQSAFTTTSQNLNKSVSTGVYQLSTRCWADRWDEWCANAATFEQLSNNPSELARYKSEWQIKEQEELRSVATQKWSVAAIIVAVTALAILWPWILVKIWPNLRRRLSLFLIIAILLQAPIALILFGGPFIWSHDLWQLAAFVSSIILGLSILGEIIFIIVRKVGSRNVPI